ncbi:hypothetical protein V3C99_005497 [Haemonchus contortus]
MSPLKIAFTIAPVSTDSPSLFCGKKLVARPSRVGGIRMLVPVGRVRLCPPISRIRSVVNELVAWSSSLKQAHITMTTTTTGSELSRPSQMQAPATTDQAQRRQRR